jgi:uncharacterized protein
MQLYAVADIHGKPRRIEMIKKTISTYNPDLLIVAGDITNYTNPGAVLAELDGLPVPVLAIRGNTDPERVERMFHQYRNILPLHLKEVVMDDVSFVGVSGTIPVPFSSRICFREKQMISQLEPLVKPGSVLVAHPPPEGTLDRVMGRFHAGCRSLRRLMARCRPCLVICGHIHEASGKEYMGKSLVVNCAMGRKRAGALIDMDQERVVGVKML